MGAGYSILQRRSGKIRLANQCDRGCFTIVSQSGIVSKVIAVPKLPNLLREISQNLLS
jgi:hypothetical protein